MQREVMRVVHVSDVAEIVVRGVVRATGVADVEVRRNDAGVARMAMIAMAVIANPMVAEAVGDDRVMRRAVAMQRQVEHAGIRVAAVGVVAGMVDRLRDLVPESAMTALMAAAVAAIMAAEHVTGELEQVIERRMRVAVAEVAGQRAEIVADGACLVSDRLRQVTGGIQHARHARADRVADAARQA